MGAYQALKALVTCPEFLISTSGCWIFFLSVGIVRGLTVVQDALIRYFQSDATTVMSLSATLLAAYAIGGPISGYVIPKYGAKKPTIFAGFSCCLGLCLCGALLHLQNIPLIAALLFFLVGLPQGVAINAVLGSAKSNVRHDKMGLVMTLVGGGISLASLILPLVFTEFCAAVGNCGNVPDDEPVRGLEELFYFLGGMNLIMIISGMIMLEKERETTEGDDAALLEHADNQKEQASLWSWTLTKDPIFVLHLTGQLIFFASYFCMFPLAADMLVSVGFDRDYEIPALLLLLGLVEFIARLTYAFCLADRFNKISLMGLTYLGDGLGFLLLLGSYHFRPREVEDDFHSGNGMDFNNTSNRTDSTNLYNDFSAGLYDRHLCWAFTILAFVVGGFFNAGFGGLLNAVLVEIVNPKLYAIAVGMQALMIGIGETIGPFIGGAIADASVPSFCTHHQEAGFNKTDTVFLEQLHELDLEFDELHNFCGNKQFWHCFVAGSIGMVISSMITGFMKYYKDSRVATI